MNNGRSVADFEVVVKSKGWDEIDMYKCSWYGLCSTADHSGGFTRSTHAERNHVFVG